MKNYRFCNCCSSCEFYEKNGYCLVQKDVVNSFYTCDEWKEGEDEEEGE